MIGDTSQHLAQICLRVQAVELRRTDQAVNSSRTLASAVGPRKKIIFSTQSDGTQRPLCRVVVYLNAAIVTIAHQCRPAGERVTNRRRRVRLPGKLGYHSFEPLPQGF